MPIWDPSGVRWNTSRGPICGLSTSIDIRRSRYGRSCEVSMPECRMRGARSLGVPLGTIANITGGSPCQWWANGRRILCERWDGDGGRKIPEQWWSGYMTTTGFGGRACLEVRCSGGGLLQNCCSNHERGTGVRDGLLALEWQLRSRTEKIRGSEHLT